MTATITPPSNGATTCRSPDSCSRAPLATPHWISSSDMLGRPFPHHDGGPLRHLGLDLELVHQSPSAGKPKPEPAAGGVGVAHGELDVGNPGARVARHHDDPLLP